MTNEQILKKAIEKAVKNGYPIGGQQLMSFNARNMGKTTSYVWMIKGLIFSHDFAKAFWGEKLIQDRDDYYSPAWEVHLQQMVLEKDLIKYLEKFI